MMLYSCEPVYAGSALNEGMERIAIIRGAEQSGGSDKNKIAVILNIKKVSGLEEKRRGLSDVESMPEDSGMLFVLEPWQQNNFWMKGMKFPLDILFFDGDRRLTGLFSGLLPCDDCPVISAPKGSAYALEINAGTAKKYGIRRGDSFIVSKDE